MVKTATGTVANDLVRQYPAHTFVMEDLDLNGCRGQKRFAYRALHGNLTHKAVVDARNPAYTSQMCPSCGYVSRGNRAGTKFVCVGCGRISHADAVGGINLLGRSEDKQVGANDSPFVAKALLRERYRARRRDSSSGSQDGTAPVPSGRRLTVREPRSGGSTSHSLECDRGIYAHGFDNGHVLTPSCLPASRESSGRPA